MNKKLGNHRNRIVDSAWGRPQKRIIFELSSEKQSEPSQGKQEESIPEKKKKRQSLGNINFIGEKAMSGRQRVEIGTNRKIDQSDCEMFNWGFWTSFFRQSGAMEDWSREVI